MVAVNLDPQADDRIHDDDVARRFRVAGALVPEVEAFALATAPLVQEWGFLGMARVGQELSVRSRVREVFARRGHSYVACAARPAGGRRVQGRTGRSSSRS